MLKNNPWLPRVFRRNRNNFLRVISGGGSWLINWEKVDYACGTDSSVGSWGKPVDDPDAGKDEGAANPYAWGHVVGSEQ